jgi:aspartate dehydrogenase
MPNYVVGIIGFGVIGKTLFQAIADGRAGQTGCPAVLVRNSRSADEAPAALTCEREHFLSQRFDAVVECAGHSAVQELGESILQRADLLITSVGALCDDALFARLRHTAKTHGHKLLLPAAGIGALDTLTAAAAGRLDSVTITVRKNIAAWYGTPAEQLFDLGRLQAATTVYEGPVRAGARLYPANVNIAAAVALAGIGLDRTQLRIIADPAIATHIVEVEASGEFGRFHFSEDVIPEPANPKTGKIVALALLKTIRQLSSELVIGG